MKLNGKQFEAISKSLLDAFNLDSLKAMVRIQLEEQLEQIARPGPLPKVVHDMIEWAEKKDRVQQLIDGAYTSSRSNRMLQELQVQYQTEKWFDASPQSRPGIPSPPYPYFAHPYALQSNFTGRTAERQNLTEWLQSDIRSVLTLVAVGGMGKSSLVWYWLQNDIDLSRWDAILWWSFYEADASFSRFLDEALLYIGKDSVDPTKLASDYDKTSMLLNHLRQRRTLLVCDGFERLLLAYASMGVAYQQDTQRDESTDARSCVNPNVSRLLRDLVAGPTQAKVVLTTRLMVSDLEDRSGVPLAGCRKEELHALSPDDAVTFMRLQGVTKGTDNELRTACEVYGYHPLSLRLLSGLVARDKRKPGDISTAPRHNVQDNLLARKHHVLETAFNALPETLRLLLSRMAAFRHPMPYDAVAILSEYKTEHEFDEALEELIERGLLFFDMQHVRYDLHPIVRSYAYDRLIDRAKTHARLRNYFENIPSPDGEKVRSIDDIAPVIELFHHSVRAGFFESAARLFESRLRDILYFRLAAYTEYTELSREFLNAAQVGAEVKPSDILRTQNRLGVALQKMGMLSEARAVLEQVNQASQGGRNTNLYFRTLNNIAQIDRDLGELRKAERTFQMAVSIAKQFGDNLEIGRGLQELGLTESFLGRFEEATAHLLQADQVQYAVEHNRSFAYLALTHLQQGSLEEASDALAHAQKIAIGYARNQTWLDWLCGKLALAQGQFSKSNSFLNTAVTTCRRHNLAELQPNVLLEYAYLRLMEAKLQSDNSLSQNLFLEARRHAEEALAVAERCHYRLKQADLHNFLAEWNFCAGYLSKAHDHAKTAREMAWCDGPPYCYYTALNQAERLLLQTR
jgi:tetratricopeptide (TPR) repeat protein